MKNEWYLVKSNFWGVYRILSRLQKCSYESFTMKITNHSDTENHWTTYAKFG